MTIARLLILICGPIPIVALSMAVSSWFKGTPAAALAPNNIVTGSVDPASAGERANSVHAEAGLAYKANRSQDDSTLVEQCQHCGRRLARQLDPTCHLVVRSPFVIAGDLSDEALEHWHRNTILPVTEAIETRFCRTPPNQPIVILLLATDDSYDRIARQLYGDEGISVYGYYKRFQRTLVLNISTGGGTLAHELTHALLDCDFPTAPDWLNEGLASLHEQCRFRDAPGGVWIEGLDNWRLPILQSAIRAGRLRSLRSLTMDDDFRTANVALNYAQSRYFCLYLQQCGLLADFYHAFRDHVDDDPRGDRSLFKVLPGQSWARLDAEFQQWAMARGSAAPTESGAAVVTPANSELGQ